MLPFGRIAIIGLGLIGSSESTINVKAEASLG